MDKKVKIILVVGVLLLLVVVSVVAYKMITGRQKASDNNYLVNENSPTGWQCISNMLCIGDACYVCNEDIYNCANFNSQEDAQRLFDCCESFGFGDIHRLDADGNGVACESLR